MANGKSARRQELLRRRQPPRKPSRHNWADFVAKVKGRAPSGSLAQPPPRSVRTVGTFSRRYHRKPRYRTLQPDAAITSPAASPDSNLMGTGAFRRNRRRRRGIALVYAMAFMLAM